MMLSDNMEFQEIFMSTFLQMICLEGDNTSQELYNLVVYFCA
jgi:hypothetical protein